jgi:predicted MPP superfamily phosphohydrolase
MTRFLAFISLYLLVYGGMHAYFFVKVKTALSSGRASSVVLILFLVLMVLSPMLMWRLADFELGRAIAPIALLTYTWMGFVFLFCSAYLLMDLYSLLLKLIGSFAPEIAALRSSHRGLTLTVVILLCLCISVYGYFAAREIRVERVPVYSKKLPENIDNFRIVQISDVHLGVMIQNDWFRRVVQRINTLQPDLIVATGDIIDRHVDGAEEFSEIFSLLNANAAKYAVTGNHEFFAGIEKAVTFLQDSGFTVLRGERVTLGGWLHLVGVDDRAGDRFGGLQGSSESELLLEEPANSFTLLLKHQPIIATESVGHYDLQLSGHIHQGQIFPFIYLTRLFYPVESGMNELEKGSKLYVSRGSGTWGPPIRFLAPPEITVFDIMHSGD